MSNPIEKYLSESGRDVLLIEKDKFLNDDDINTLISYCYGIRSKMQYRSEVDKSNDMVEKLEYIRGLLK